MKTIRLIAALYILFLSVYPCTDGQTCADERKAGISYTNSSSHDHTNNEQDFCSPFCICACCATHAQMSRSTVMPQAEPQHNTKISTFYFERPLLNDAKAIWQPPKIS